MDQWKFWVDRGGTFTDVIGISPEGRIYPGKVLSLEGQGGKNAVFLGIEKVLRDAGFQGGLPEGEIRMGTTVTTNALLEKKWEAPLLLITRGFGDLFRIGNQSRRDLFSLQLDPPVLLYNGVLEVDGRIDARGGKIDPLDPEALLDQLRQKRAEGISSIAVVLMHSLKNPTHEKRIRELAQQAGMERIFLSHEESQVHNILSRGETCLLQAYLQPVLERYTEEISRKNRDTLFMQSSGGLIRPGSFSAKNSLLSGPAAGVMGAIALSERNGLDRIIGFDMGGTSTDVFHYRGEREMESESVIAGVRNTSPRLSIHTIASGGGSILFYQNGKFRVGPESAGAFPGPACYRNGGPLTVTDANLILGRIPLALFPSVFGPEKNEPPDRTAARSGFERLREETGKEGYFYERIEAVADGFRDIATGQMADAISHISTRRGYDLSEYTLVAFGGAGGQHAISVASRLGMKGVLFPGPGGLLCAYGMGTAPTGYSEESFFEHGLVESVLPELEKELDRLQSVVLDKFPEASGKDRPKSINRYLYLRLEKGYWETRVLYESLDQVRSEYEKQFIQTFGFPLNQKVMIQRIQVEAVSPADNVPPWKSGGVQDPILATPVPPNQQSMYWNGEFHQVPVYYRMEIVEGAKVPGPALILSPNDTIVIEEGWGIVARPDGDLFASPLENRSTDEITMHHSTSPSGDGVDPSLLEIFHEGFMNVAVEMGIVLQKTARSVNIRERLDFSCAVFDDQGNLITNAPHIPVHLGSMEDAVKAIRDRCQPQPDEVYITNDPYNGGTHLPDITLVTRIRVGGGDEPLEFYLAVRGHHGDVGGIVPGSMPALSKKIDDEGVVFSGFCAYKEGHWYGEEIKQHFERSAFPPRDPETLLLDLQAQMGALRRGKTRMEELVDRFGIQKTALYRMAIRENARRSIQKVRELFPEKVSRTVFLDNGARLSLTISNPSPPGPLVFDFTGTGPVNGDNFNAPLPIVKAAILYALRTLVDQPIPLNQGCLQDVEIIVPEGSFLNPLRPAAVVAGNVELSQQIVDLIYHASGVLAESVGSMNNVSFGNDRFQYYETISGGQGASSSFPGGEGRQLHMTNSRITDPEVLERNVPVRLNRFSIRPGSGGAGNNPGGNGLVRSFTFLEDCELSVLSSRRIRGAEGLAGGGPGKPGENRIIKPDGSSFDPGPCFSLKVNDGTTFVIETPGGGGYGTIG